MVKFPAVIYAAALQVKLPWVWLIRPLTISGELRFTVFWPVSVNAPAVIVELVLLVNAALSAMLMVLLSVAAAPIVIVPLPAFVKV